LQSLDIVRRIILKWFFNAWGGIVWAELMWQDTRENYDETSGFIKGREFLD
jgi:hypothetical protein